MFLTSTPNNLKLLLQIILSERAPGVWETLACQKNDGYSVLHQTSLLFLLIVQFPYAQSLSENHTPLAGVTTLTVSMVPSIPLGWWGLWDTNDWLEFLNRDAETLRRLNAFTNVPTFLSFPAWHQSSFGTAVPHIHLADSLIQALLLLVTGLRLEWNNSEGLWGSSPRSCPSALQRPLPSAPLVTECLLLCPVIQIGFKPPASALHCNAIFFIQHEIRALLRPHVANIKEEERFC